MAENNRHLALGCAQNNLPVKPHSAHKGMLKSRGQTLATFLCERKALLSVAGSAIPHLIFQTTNANQETMGKTC